MQLAKFRDRRSNDPRKRSFHAAQKRAQCAALFVGGCAQRNVDLFVENPMIDGAAIASAINPFNIRAPNAINQHRIARPQCYASGFRQGRVG